MKNLMFGATEYEKKQRNLKIGIFLVLTIILIFLIIFIPSSSSFTFIIGFLYIIFLFLLIQFHSKNYKLFYKKNIINDLIKSYDDSFRYLPNIGISSNLYKDAEFEQYFDRYTSEDSISGNFQNKFPFTMAEVKTENETKDSKGRSSYTTIFKGLFIHITLDKQIPAKIHIRKNSLIKTKFSLFNFKINKLERVEMDSPDFEKVYDVYSNNNIITMQFFTSSHMQMIMDFKKKYKIYPEFTIKNNSLYLRFSSSKAIFEPKPFKKMLDYSCLNKEYEFITSIMNICNLIIENISTTLI